jgi:protein phosphatase
MDLTQVLEIASCTDPGRVRSHNEDSIATDPANGLVVLADGMGGYNAG